MATLFFFFLVWLAWKALKAICKAIFRPRVRRSKTRYRAEYKTPVDNSAKLARLAREIEREKKTQLKVENAKSDIIHYSGVIEMQQQLLNTYQSEYNRLVNVSNAFETAFNIVQDDTYGNNVETAVNLFQTAGGYNETKNAKRLETLTNKIMAANAKIAIARKKIAQAQAIIEMYCSD